MPNLSSISHSTLKIIFVIHFVLTTWGLQGRWCPQSAIFYNLLFFGCLIWATHNTESDEPLQFALIINVLAILFDVIMLAIYFNGDNASQRFSGILMIANLIFRLFSTKYLVKIGQQRGGTLATLFPSGAGEFGRQQYEDISYPVPENNDFAGI
ncbi:uncharacterized protein LOC123269496 [Cotesia glomerata]|uniref:Type-1 angiotensin II receptor-associated protein n=1 Tax=Cotesia glomerata TaxID=32391 RepID=A0AAV7IBG6_COTGL|nr:uncharacterized protein LOC123269496 [Cotesia glomerata]KAH0547431.1 hypothetical protein KQX54_019302 [Cotesia glomerata]